MKEFPILGRFLYTMISRGVKSSGTFNPDETMFYFEESLTSDEYHEVKAFLQWCHEGMGKRDFGHGNYEERYAEFKRLRRLQPQHGEPKTHT